jgi:hypothetical protein
MALALANFQVEVFKNLSNCTLLDRQRLATSQVKLKRQRGNTDMRGTRRTCTKKSARKTKSIALPIASLFFTTNHCQSFTVLGVRVAKTTTFGE